MTRMEVRCQPQDAVQEIVHRLWGHAQLRPLQREAMQAGRGQWGRAEGGPPWGPVSPAG